jgi:hypothetical protein
MKKIINYFKALFAVVFVAITFTACSEDVLGTYSNKLGIKTFFPTKVVTNQPLTINGSGFNGVQEIVFPGGVKVTDFEIVSDDMIRVNTPSGIPEEGGNIILRSDNDEVKSPVSLTLGHTVVSGFSKQEGETASGGELITVYGTDLEFINSVELLDADGVPQLIDHKNFYRKGTSNLIFRLPLKNLFNGAFVGILHTYDGMEFPMPELTYEPSADGGHWEKERTTIWKNNGSGGVVDWGNENYRFGLDGHDGNNECDATFPQEIWDKLKSTKFYVLLEGENPQIRVTTGWWSINLTADDIQLGNELLTNNEDGTWTLTVDLTANPELIGLLDEQHLLFTGSGYTLQEIYFEEDVWVDGGGHMEIIKTTFWKHNGLGGVVDWGNENYRFGLDGHDGNNECDATFPQEIWDKLKSAKFYVLLEGENPQIRVTTGWWSVNLTADDIQPGNELLTDNGDGTWILTVDLTANPELVALLDEQHLLFTGGGYTPLEIYTEEEVWVGGDNEEKEVTFWENNGSGGVVDWGNENYRFGLDGHDGNNECDATFPQEIWDKLKSTKFYVLLEGDNPQIRVTTGWWSINLTADDIQPGNELLTNNEDGTWTLTVDLTANPDLVALLDEQHLLFTGGGYTPLKLYFK